jgi:DNA polymerase sigma
MLSYELVCRIVRDTYPELSINFDIYGSMATKLAIDTSDMDIAIYGINSD